MFLSDADGNILSTHSEKKREKGQKLVNFWYEEVLNRGLNQFNFN